MYIPFDVICKTCRQVFCCGNCRYKHELKKHGILVRNKILPAIMSAKENQANEEGVGVVNKLDNIESIFLCPICEKRPFPLVDTIPSEIMTHMQKHHLPLQCEKCFKMYKNVSDLKEFSKCCHIDSKCENQESLTSNNSSNTNEISIITVTRPITNTISTQTTPIPVKERELPLTTPDSVVKMRLKVKSNTTHGEFVSDSVSSIKNISSLSNHSLKSSIIETSLVKGKIIRSTSTPVQLEMMFARPKEQIFSTISATQLSSICNSGAESDVGAQQNAQLTDVGHQYRKVTGPRAKMSAVTPLRQVMSKSIHKAIVAHKFAGNSASIGIRSDYKNMPTFLYSPQVHSDILSSPLPDALDLRMSPVVRRSQEQAANDFKNQIASATSNGNQVLLSTQKVTTESIVITRTKSTSITSKSPPINYFKEKTSKQSLMHPTTTVEAEERQEILKTCTSSVQIITANREECDLNKCERKENKKLLDNGPRNAETPITRIPGAVINKKIIKFESSAADNSSSPDSTDTASEVFFTPNTTPTRESVSSPEDGKFSKQVPKNFLISQYNHDFTPRRKPTLKQCAHSTAFSCLDRLDWDDKNYDEALVQIDLNVSDETVAEVKTEKKTSYGGGLWSLVSSVMRLASLKANEPKIESLNNKATNDSKSIIRRCASIAGSFIKPVVDGPDVELQPLKRKRPIGKLGRSDDDSNLFLATNAPVSPNSIMSNTSTKRFRIQGRRPIDRLRTNSLI